MPLSGTDNKYLKSIATKSTGRDRWAALRQLEVYGITLRPDGTFSDEPKIDTKPLPKRRLGRPPKVKDSPDKEVSDNG